MLTDVSFCCLIDICILSVAPGDLAAYDAAAAAFGPAFTAALAPAAAYTQY